MKTIPRLISYLFFALLLSLLPLSYYSVIPYFEGSQGNSLFLGMLAVLLGLNMVYSWYILKFASWKKIVFAVAVCLTGYLLTALLIRVGINVENNMEGIGLWLIGNALFTIIIWEIIYQVTKGSFSKTIISR